MRFSRAVPGMLDRVNKILSNETTLNKFISLQIHVEIDFYARSPLLSAILSLLFVIIGIIGIIGIIDILFNNNRYFIGK